MSFERIESQLDDIALDLAEMKPRVERADREVFGNGRPGLSAQMASVQATQKLALKILGGLGLAAIALLGSILVALI